MKYNHTILNDGLRSLLWSTVLVHVTGVTICIYRVSLSQKTPDHSSMRIHLHLIKPWDYR